jgi:D-sedoheptulose 7-phosphate isomerase
VGHQSPRYTFEGYFVHGVSLKEMNSTSIAPGATVAAKVYFASLQVVLARLDISVIDRMTDAIWENYGNGRTLYVFGNGGSAALASHFACDMGKGTVAPQRKRLRTVALTDNVPLMTALANDLGYKDIFSEQLAGLAEKGDMAFAISGSGNSPNVVQGLEMARKIGLRTLVLTGFAGGLVKSLADLCLIVPSDDMQHIEDAHLCATHAIFRAIRHRMTQAHAG